MGDEIESKVELCTGSFLISLVTADHEIEKEVGLPVYTVQFRFPARDPP